MRKGMMQLLTVVVLMCAATISAMADCGDRPGPGIDWTGTKSDEANTSGAMIGNAAACAVSGSFTASPTPANTHESAYPNRSTSAIPPR
jgi:hypothetical protein